MKCLVGWFVCKLVWLLTRCILTARRPSPPSPPLPTSVSPNSTLSQSPSILGHSSTALGHSPSRSMDSSSSPRHGHNVSPYHHPPHAHQPHPMPQGHSHPSLHHHFQPGQVFTNSHEGSQSQSLPHTPVHEEYAPRPPPHAAPQPSHLPTVGMGQKPYDPSYQIVQSNIGRVIYLINFRSWELAW